ncbi:hypothetical protein, partial [Porphyromonas macacae]|uniref:hypothetical protein n=1 Tax=Porphyromonas macacae TaxID=28115 RepID=UPI0035A0BBF3
IKKKKELDNVRNDSMEKYKPPNSNFLVICYRTVVFEGPSTFYRTAIILVKLLNLGLFQNLEALTV